MTRSFHPTAPLFVPGDRPERFAKAAASGADAVIIDLEDAVAPDGKPFARSRLAADLGDIPVMVRINAIGTPWHAEDLLAVSALPLAGLMIPKAEASPALQQIGERMAGRMGVIALIETARGLADSQAIASMAGVQGLAFGSIDFSVDIGCLHEREALLLARNTLVLNSRLAGKQAPLDGVTTAIGDADLVLSDARHARSLGFGGKLCIHPRQIRPVLEGFRSTADERAWAEGILAGGKGAYSIDGQMVDEPVRLRARRILGQ